MHRLPAAALASLTLVACSGAGPVLDPIGDQVVAVGSQLVVEVKASSASGEIRYAFKSNAPSMDGATMTRRPDGTGLFLWTPTAAHVGKWVFDFSAADQSGTSTESVAVEVRSAIGSNSLPQFQRPLGAGTAVEIAEGEEGRCKEIQIVVTDQDSTEVRLAEEEPRIEGATLFQDTELSALWRWCPTAAQRKAQDRYLLTLSADDGENPKALKRYQIILREPKGRVCGGDPPLLAHVAENRSTRSPLTITAEVSDDVGLKAAPLLYHSTTPPPVPPDLSQMVQVNMELITGDSRSGTWRAEAPNPVADAAPGAEQTLYYVLVAEDNDDSGGKCDHLVTESFAMTVTAPASGGELGLCEPCASDAQCGGEGALCMRAGVEGEAFCFPRCGAAGECPSGTACSASELESVDGATGRQCVPVDERCEVGPVCADDELEQNDGRSMAQVIPAGRTDSLRMCPIGALQADEDWYEFTVTGDTETRVRIDGDAYPNMELALLDSSGTLVAASEDWGSTDDVERCLSPGTYHIRVYSYFVGENDYSIELTTTPGDCRQKGGGTCTDDPFEDDDRAEQARVPDFEGLVFRSTENQICSGDDDWFFITMFSGETLHTTLAFDQVAAEEDLDLVIYDSSGNLLVGCTEADPYECDPYNGQSGTSDEEMVFTAPTLDEYYIVVRGWAASENQYDICMSLEAGSCVLN